VRIIGKASSERPKGGVGRFTEVAGSKGFHYCMTILSSLITGRLIIMGGRLIETPLSTFHQVLSNFQEFVKVSGVCLLLSISD